MMTLMILVGATWMGLYLAKRITEPVQRLATAAQGNRGRASRLSRRSRNGERRRVRIARRGVQQHGERSGEEPPAPRALDRRPRAQAPRGRRAPAVHRDDPRADRHRRRVDRRGGKNQHAQQRGHAAARAWRRRRSGSRRRRCSAATICSRSARCSAPRRTGRTEPSAQEIPLTRDDRELQLAAVATALRGTEGSDGMVLVVDDVSPLIRAQKVAAWREVARRLAHEIKNPLTPIQLCAERIRRHFSSSAGPTLDARRGVHVDDRRRSRFAEGARRRVLAVRADAGAARGADRSARAAERGAGAVSGAARRGAFRAALRGEAAEGARGRRADSPRHHQPRRQRHRGDEPLGRHHARNAARSGRVARAADRHRRRPGHPCGGAGEAVHAVLFDQAPRQRPRPRHRPAHRRRARRDDRGRRQRAARAPNSPSNCHADSFVSTQRRQAARMLFERLLDLHAPSAPVRSEAPKRL